MLLIFWGPKWTDPTQPDFNTFQDIITQEQQLFDGLGGSGYNGILTQYYDNFGHVVNNAGWPVLYDSIEDGTTPPSNIDQTAEAFEISDVAQQIPEWPFVQDKLVILMPQEGSTYTDPMLAPSGQGTVCGYHYVTNDGNNNLYAMVPYLADAPFGPSCPNEFGDSTASDPLAAAMTVTASHEYAETVTDPWDNNSNTYGWTDQQQKQEIADLCLPEYLPDTTLAVNTTIWVSDLFDNSDYSLDSTKGCVAASTVFVQNPSTYNSSVFAEYAGVYGTAAITANDIWAVGYCACNGYYQTLEEHYDGSSWTVAANPPVTGGTNAVLWGVSAVSSTDVWAAGNYLSSSLNTYQTLIEHYNGTSWSVMPSPNADGRTTPNSVLSDIVALSPTNVWAVGEAYSSKVDQALIEHYDGTSWSIVAAPSISKTSTWLTRIAAVPNSAQLWAVGGQQASSGGTSTTQTLVEYYNGSSWSVSLSSSLNQSPSYNILQAVRAISPTDILVVGNYTFTNGAQQPIIGYYDGTQWQYTAPEQTNLGENYHLTSVSVDPADSTNIWVGGYMSNVTSSTDQPLLIYIEPSGSGLCTSSSVCATFFPCAADGTGNNEVTTVAVIDAEHVWPMGKYDNYNGYVLADEYLG